MRKTVALPEEIAQLWEDLAKRQFGVTGSYKRGAFLEVWLPRIARVMDAEAKADALANAERERFFAMALAQEQSAND